MKSKKTKSKLQTVTPVIDKLQKELDKKISNLTKEYQKKIKVLTKDQMQCLDNDCFYVRGKIDYYPRKQSCMNYYPKSEFKIVTITETECEQISSDCGYGDYDEFAWVKRKSKYRVCPNCKSAIQISSEVLAQSPSWTRMDSKSHGFQAPPKPE